MADAYYVTKFPAELRYGLFVPPEQRELLPEAMLMLAVLQDAIACVKGEGCARPHERVKLARMARDWMFDERREDLFSFRNICETLQLDPDPIRKVVQRPAQTPIGRVA